MTQVFARAGVRFKEGFDPDLAEYHYPYGTPEEMALHLEPLQQFDKAHIVMLTEEGVIPRQDGVAMLRVLREMERSGTMLEQRAATHQGYYSGETILIEKLGREVGGRIHTARATACFRGTTTRWVLRDHLLGVMDECVALREVMLRMARQHTETAMPGFSHDYRHNVAWTFAHYLLSWVFLMGRDFDRLLAAYDRSNWSVAGTIAGAGSEIPINQERVADLLGFTRIYENNRDVTRNYDYVLEAESALMIFHSAIARLGEDLDLWMTDEFRMVDIADRYCITSSILAQKKNPWVLEALRGKHTQLLGIVTAAHAIFAHPSDIYNTSLWDVIPAAELVWRSTRLMRGVMETLTVDTARMRKLASADWAQASDLMSAIVVEKGMAFRTAHQITGLLVRLCKERGIDPDGATLELLEEAALGITGQPLGLSEATFRRALDPMAAVEARSCAGGTAPAEARRNIEIGAGQVKAHRDQITGRKQALVDARERLEKAVDALLEGAPA